METFRTSLFSSNKVHCCICFGLSKRWIAAHRYSFKVATRHYDGISIQLAASRRFPKISRRFSFPRHLTPFSRENKIKRKRKRSEDKHSHLAAWLRSRDFRGVSKAHLGRTFLVLSSSRLYLSISISRHVGESGRVRSDVCKMLPAERDLLFRLLFPRIALGQRTAKFKGEKVSASEKWESVSLRESTEGLALPRCRAIKGRI